MMNKEAEQEFEKHIKKVCKDKTLFSHARSYFQDFCSYYEGVSFSRDDFEKLTIGNTIYEQDVVIDLFANTDKVSAEEVFVYLFKQNIKSLDFYSEKLKGYDSVAGYFSFVEKKIGIKRISKRKREEAKTFVVKVSEPKKKLTKEEKKEEKQKKKQEKKEEKERQAIQRKEMLEYQEKEIKSTVYHELSHIFENKSFNKGEFVKKNLSDMVIVRRRDKENFVCYSSKIQMEIDKKKIDTALEVIKLHSRRKNFTFDEIYRHPLIIEDRLSSLKEKGLTAISEILNEVHSRQISGEINSTKKLEGKVKDGLIFKESLYGNCAYQKDYNDSELLKLLMYPFDEKKMRVDSKSILEKLNDMQVSKENLDRIKKSFLNEILSDASVNDFKEIITDASAFETYIYIFSYINNNFCVIDDEEHIARLLTQELLVESLQNDIIKQINDPSIKKDTEFFKRLNSTLRIIDNNIGFPKGQTKFKSRGQDPRFFETKEYNNIDIFSIEELAKITPELKHLQSFKTILDEVKKITSEKGSDIKDIDKTMDFLAEQKRKDEELKKLKEEEVLALKERQEYYEQKYDYKSKIEKSDFGREKQLEDEWA